MFRSSDFFLCAPRHVSYTPWQLCLAKHKCLSRSSICGSSSIYVQGRDVMAGRSPTPPVAFLHDYDVYLVLHSFFPARRKQSRKVSRVYCKQIRSCWSFNSFLFKSFQFYCPYKTRCYRILPRGVIQCVVYSYNFSPCTVFLLVLTVVVWSSRRHRQARHGYLGAAGEVQAHIVEL